MLVWHGYWHAFSALAQTRPPLLSYINNPALLVLSASQDLVVVSADGVGLFQPDPAGKPQVFYLGKVVQPVSLYTPGPKVGNMV